MQYLVSCPVLEYYAVGSYTPPGNMTMPGYYKNNVGIKSGTPNLPEAPNPPKDGTDNGEFCEFYESIRTEKCSASRLNTLQIGAQITEHIL